MCVCICECVCALWGRRGRGVPRTLSLDHLRVLLLRCSPSALREVFLNSSSIMPLSCIQCATLKHGAYDDCRYLAAEGRAAHSPMRMVIMRVLGHDDEAVFWYFFLFLNTPQKPMTCAPASYQFHARNTCRESKAGTCTNKSFAVSIVGRAYIPHETILRVTKQLETCGGRAGGMAGGRVVVANEPECSN